MLSEQKSLSLLVNGLVQGVGFRPYVYQIATQMSLKGWVANSNQGVIIEIEGSQPRLETFLETLQSHLPQPAQISSLKIEWNPAIGYSDFQIKPSIQQQKNQAFILPDLATCTDCIEELFAPENRRYRYPFINCTYCGPRFSMITSLPYDRIHTTMNIFEMCQPCQREYQNPLNRRFHAQPIACPDCGPQLSWWNKNGQMIAQREDALKSAIQQIKSGAVIAVKGLSGFHLMADPFHCGAVEKLRRIKARPHKALALMYPDLNAIKTSCTLNQVESKLLSSRQAPIVLLHRNKDSYQILSNIAPDCRTLGVILSYTPLHHLLLSEFNHPLIVTSGNRSGERVYTDETALFKALSPHIDGYLVHNRPISQFADDSVTQVIEDKVVVLRRARGYAPFPIELPTSLPCCLAVGGHLKNTVAVNVDNQIFLSQYIGTLDNAKTLNSFKQTIDHFQTIYQIKPQIILRDLHPDYHSSQYAQTFEKEVISVQHHYAHILSCMAEHQLNSPLLGVAWDGSGLGTDGSIWGGEFLGITSTGFKRKAHLKPFLLPGGEQAIKEPFRAAMGLLYSAMGDKGLKLELAPNRILSPEKQALMKTLLKKQLHSPLTSSMGRLFDAIASLLNICHYNTYEAQAAIKLEARTLNHYSYHPYPFQLIYEKETLIIDYLPILEAIIKDLKERVPLDEIITRFHFTLVDIIDKVVKELNYQTVVLSGGCFQNRFLLEHTIRKLKQSGYQPFWNQSIPPNDGGIAVGQIMANIQRNNKNVSGSTRFN